MTMHPVNYPYTMEEMRLMFDYAHAHDVTHGGCYDARHAAILLWSQPWTTEGEEHLSDLVGAWYFHWYNEYRMTDIHCEPGTTLPAMLHTLALLEHGALGYVRHGVERPLQE